VQPSYPVLSEYSYYTVGATPRSTSPTPPTASTFTTGLYAPLQSSSWATVGQTPSTMAVPLGTCGQGAPSSKPTRKAKAKPAEAMKSITNTAQAPQKEKAAAPASQQQPSAKMGSTATLHCTETASLTVSVGTCS
jgi:hypothetical protein